MLCRKALRKSDVLCLHGFLLLRNGRGCAFSLAPDRHRFCRNLIQGTLRRPQSWDAPPRRERAVRQAGWCIVHSLAGITNPAYVSFPFHHPQKCYQTEISAWIIISIRGHKNTITAKKEKTGQQRAKSAACNPASSQVYLTYHTAHQRLAG